MTDSHEPVATLVPGSACSGAQDSTSHAKRFAVWSRLGWVVLPPVWLVRTIWHNPLRSLIVAGSLGLTCLGLVLASRELGGAHHLRAAQAALAKYHNSEAQRHLQEYFRLFPDHAAAMLPAARTARRLRQFDRAEGYLNRYRRLRGEDDALFFERLLLRAERGDMDSLKKTCRALMDNNDPEASLLLEALASGYLRTYRLQDAATCINLWLELEPKNTQALLDQGIMHELRSQHREAADVFREIVKLDPEHDEARLRYAGSLLELSQAQEALPHLEYLRNKDSGNFLVESYLARCQDQLGNAAEAVRLLEESLARRPGNPVALGELGKLAMRQGRLDEAERNLRRSCEISPRDYRYQYQLYLCLKRLGKTAEAQKINAGLKTVEQDMKRLQELVLSQMQHRPNDAELAYEMGELALRSGVIQEALRWFDKALALNPGHVATHEALSRYYHQAGEIGRAHDHWKKAHPETARK